MSKKTALIIIVTIVLLASVGFLIFYFYINQGQGTGIGTTGDRSNIFPDTPSGSATPSGQTSDGTPETPTGTTGNETQTALTLKELSKRPSAGAVVLATSSAQGITVRFMERSTGNVYDVPTDTGAEIRVSNTTIPKIQEALWNKDGAKVIARYVGESRDLIKTYSGILTKLPDQSEGSIQGVYLADNIQSIATNPDQNKIFYLLKHSEGSTGIISDFDGA